MTTLYAPEINDKRMEYAVKYLIDMGYNFTQDYKNADYLLPAVKPSMDYSSIPLKQVEYMKNESFLLKNAYLTAESAVSVAIQNSNDSIINAPILIAGYGRIGKALHKYLAAFTGDVTVCARSTTARALANSNNAKTIDINDLKENNDYKFIFNTIPHPVFNEKELGVLNKDSIIIDLASFPGGVDKHMAQALGLNLIIARGLPAKYSPKTAGFVLSKASDEFLKEANK